MRVESSVRAGLVRDRQESEAHLENMVHPDHKEIQEVPGSARAARKAQVSRIHRLLEQLDALPAD